MSCWWSAIDGQEAEGFDAICSGEPSGTTGGFQPRVLQEFGDQEQIGAAAHERGGEQDQELAYLRDVGAWGEVWLFSEVDSEACTGP